MQISEPYTKVLLITFDSNIDEKSPNYKSPEKDSYLKLLKAEFENFLNENYWGFRRVQGYEILFSEIRVAGSCGYPNTLNYYIGFRDEQAKSRFEFLMDEFQRGY